MSLSHLKMLFVRLLIRSASKVSISTIKFFLSKCLKSTLFDCRIKLFDVMSNNRKTECSDKMVILTLTWLKLLEFKGKKVKKIALRCQGRANGMTSNALINTHSSVRKVRTCMCISSRHSLIFHCYFGKLKF